LVLALPTIPVDNGLQDAIHFGQGRFLMTATATSRESIASACLAALSICLWAFTSIPDPAILMLGAACVTLAFLGLRDIRRGEGRLGWRWLAVGAVVAEVAAVVIFMGLLPAVQKVREAASRMKET
jgi:hypothetical protein